MSDPLLVTGDGQTPTTITAPVKVSTQNTVISTGNSTGTNRQGTGSTSVTASYTDVDPVTIRVEVESTAIVNIAQFNTPAFNGLPANSDALVIDDLGAGVATGEYSFEVTDPSNEEISADLNLLGLLSLKPNLSYTEETVSGASGNRIRIDIYERVASITNNNVLDTTTDIFTGSGISFTETEKVSSDFLNPSEYFDNSPLVEEDFPVINDSLAHVSGTYSTPGLLFWGLPSSETPIHRYPIRGDYFKVFRIFKDFKFKYKLVSSQTSVMPGLVSYKLTGSFIVRVSLQDPNPLLENLVDHFYTHYLDATGTPQPILTLGQLAYAIKQHKTEALYVNDQFVGTGYKVPSGNARYVQPILALEFPETELPNVTDVTSWKNKILGPISEASIDSFTSNSDAITILKLTGLPVLSEEVRVEGVVEDNNVSLQVYAPQTAVSLSSDPEQPIYSLALGQRLSSVLPSVGFDIQIDLKDLPVVSQVTGATVRAVVANPVLIGDTFDSQRQFNPYLENCSFLDTNRRNMRNYTLRWTKYQPPLCSSVSTQADFDNVIYGTLGGPTGSLAENLTFLLSSGDAYRPSLSYTTQAKNLWNILNGNPYSFKLVDSGSYLTSPYSRSNEFLPYLSYNSSATSAIVTSKIAVLDTLIDSFAAQALDYEVIEGPDSNYFIMMGARFFTEESSGSFINSNVIDEAYGVGYCSGFFEPLTGIPGGTPSPGAALLSWPVSSAYRDPHLGLANRTPVSYLGHNPATSSWPKLTGDTVNTAITTHYNERVPTLDPDAANVSDTHNNQSNHLLGLFSLLYEYVNTYLEDFLLTDLIAGTLVSDIRLEAFQVMKDILDYMDDPVSYVTTLLTSYYTGDTEFSDKVVLYDQISRQPRATSDEKGYYLETALPTFKLPFSSELQTHQDLAKNGIFLGALPYSTIYKTGMKVLIDNRLSTGVGMVDDKVIVIPKPDVHFYGGHSFDAGSQGTLVYKSPFDRWGTFENNSIMDILLLKVAKVLWKGKWVIGTSFLENPVSTLAPNSRQKASTSDTNSALVYTELEEDYWQITQVNNNSNLETINLQYEPNSRVFNGLTWVNALRDTTFKLDFSCEGEKAELTYGDQIRVQPDNFLTVIDSTAVFTDSKWTFNVSKGTQFSLSNGEDAGGLATISFQPANSPSQDHSFDNTVGTSTSFLFAATSSIIEFTTVPVVRFLKGDVYSFQVQGGQFKTLLNGASLVTGLDIDTVAQTLYSRLDISFVFNGASSFVVGDFWEFSLINENSPLNLFYWNYDKWVPDLNNPTLLLDFGAPISMDTFILCTPHTLATSDTVLVEADNSPTWGTPAFSQLMTIPDPILADKLSPFLLLDTPVTLRYVKLTFTAASNVELRKFICLDRTSDPLAVGFELRPLETASSELFYVMISGAMMSTFISKQIQWDELMLLQDFNNLKTILTHSKTNNDLPVVYIEDTQQDNSGLVGFFQDDRVLFNKQATLERLNQGGRVAVMAGVNVTFQEEEDQ